MAARGTCAATVRGEFTGLDYLTIASREQQLHLIKAFEEGLRGLGYRVGENVIINYRFADGEIDRLPALATGLLGVARHSHRGQSEHRCRQEGDHNFIPIGHDQQCRSGRMRGLWGSLARPGGNITGFSVDTGASKYTANGSSC